MFTRNVPAEMLQLPFYLLRLDQVAKHAAYTTPSHIIIIAFIFMLCNFQSLKIQFLTSPEIDQISVDCKIARKRRYDKADRCGRSLMS